MRPLPSTPSSRPPLPTPPTNLHRDSTSSHSLYAFDNLNNKSDNNASIPTVSIQVDSPKQVSEDSNDNDIKPVILESHNSIKQTLPKIPVVTSDHQSINSNIENNSSSSSSSSLSFTSNNNTYNLTTASPNNKKKLPSPPTNSNVKRTDINSQTIPSSIIPNISQTQQYSLPPLPPTPPIRTSHSRSLPQRPPLPFIPNNNQQIVFPISSPPPPPLPSKSPLIPSEPLSTTSSKPITKPTSTFGVKSLALGLSTCAGCEKVVVEGRVVDAMGVHWHPDCFNCAHCGIALEHVEYFEHEGKPYCHLDYHEHFSPYCFHCQTPILEKNFITIDDDAFNESNGPSRRLYHLNHFFCVQCGDPFLDPSSDFKELDKPYTMFKGHPYCERCHNNLHKPKCKNCNKPVIEDAVDALGGLYHVQCFVCEGCQNPFNEHEFFEQVGKPWCENCFDILIRNLV